MNRAIVIAGTTASGKSALALEVCKRFSDTYIINADSRQIYKELKIGTSQPVPDKIVGDGMWEIDGVKHHLYGHVSIEDKYNIYEYQKDVKEVLKREKGTPILVGGTGLYIDSVVFNYDLDASTKNDPMDALYLVIDVDKQELDTRIKQRIEQMFAEGLLKEAEALWRKYPGFELKPLKTIGYAELKKYFEKKQSLEEVKHQIFLHTRQYAKRQRTWFRRNKEVDYIQMPDQAFHLIQDYFDEI